MGKYNKYLDRVVIITTNKGLVLTPAALDLLGKPDRALLLNDGDGHMGIRPVKSNDPEYDNAFAIQHPGRNAKNPPTSKATSFMNCKAYLDKYNINSKLVFSTVSIENDILVVDLTKFEILKIQN